MTDHSWLIYAIQGIRDYVAQNGLDAALPAVEAACCDLEWTVGTERLGQPPRLIANELQACMLVAALRNCADLR